MQSFEDQRTRALTLLAAGDLPGALQCASAALSLVPDDLPTLGLLADLHEKTGDAAKALEMCRRLSKLAPQDPAPHLKAGQIRMSRVDYAGAEKEFAAALRLDASATPAVEGLTHLWRLSGKTAEARTLLLETAKGEASPERAAIARFKAAFTQPVIASGLDEIAESRAEYARLLAAGPAAPIGDPLAAGLGPNFFLGYQGQNDRPLQEALAHYYRKACPALVSTARHVGRRPGSKIRVGIVSNFFSHHTVGYLTHGLIEGLDRARFELILFRTPHALQDTATPRFMAAAPCVDLPNDVSAARDVIADAQLDVVHYPEIGMDHMAYFLAFARLATLQTVAWGHPITTGLPNIDHFLSVADMEPENADAHYTESLVRLKGLSFAGEPPDAPAADKQSSGLLPGPAYVCGQSLFKVHPEFDATVAALLDADREGHVYFVSLGVHADKLFRARLARSIGAHMDRLHLLPRTTKAGFLRLVKSADVVLDVPHWSGGKTSLETLALGTPVIHQPGAFMRGRHTLAFYRRMGVTAPVVESAAHYVKTAIGLAHDTAARAEVRGQIEEAQSTLFGDWASIREIEEFWAAAVAARH